MNPGSIRPTTDCECAGRDGECVGLDSEFVGRDGECVGLEAIRGTRFLRACFLGHLGAILLSLLAAGPIGCSRQLNTDAFTFSALASDGSDIMIDRPIALGATLPIEVRMKGTASSGGRPNLSSAHVDPADRIAIGEVNNPLIIRALKPGPATIEVEDNAGNRGAITVAIEAIDGIELLGELRIADISTGIGDIIGPGIVLHPSVSLELDVTMLSKDGVVLLGHDAAAWWTSNMASIELIAVSGTDKVKIRAKDQDGSAVMSFGDKIRIDVDVTTTTPIADHLRFFGASAFLTDPSETEIEPPIILPPGRLRKIAVLGFDTRNRLLAASFPRALRAETSGDPSNILLFQPDHHLLALNAVGDGEVDIDISWLEASRRMSVLVQSTD